MTNTRLTNTKKDDDGDLFKNNLASRPDAESLRCTLKLRAQKINAFRHWMNLPLLRLTWGCHRRDVSFAMRKTFKYRLYRSKRNKHVLRQIEIASEVWNHAIALHRRYYPLYGKYLNVNRLQKHITKLKKQRRFQHWNDLGSQAIQDVVQRIDRAYKLFFAAKESRRRVRPPSFCKRRKYRSFTLKQSGWKLLGSNRIRIGKRTYKFVKSREVEGAIKTVTIKRDACGDLWLCFSVETTAKANLPTTGNSAGMDFGLKTFLTVSDGTAIEAPQPLRRSLKEMARLQRSLSRKQRGSNHRCKARLRVARLHRRIADQRRDWHFKLARRLLSEFDVLYIEDLRLEGMRRLWGLKMGDLGFYSFTKILEHLATTSGKQVVKIDRYFPSSKTCSDCGGVKEKLRLADRDWVCSWCGAHHDRDVNAAINIHRVGASTYGVGNVRLAEPAVAA